MAPERSPEDITTTITAFKKLMDQHPEYEQTIAGKLQSLPVPDMADAIWSRIEAQLDIDLPTNDGGDNPPSPSPSGPDVVGWGLAVVIVALVSIFLLLKNKKESNNNQTSIPAIETIQKPIETANDPPPAGKQNAQPTITNPNPVINNTINVRQDSTLQQALTANSADVQDTASLGKAPSSVVTGSQARTDTMPAGKKKRGVSGLDDNDYRIEPKKE